MGIIWRIFYLSVNGIYSIKNLIPFYTQTICYYFVSPKTKLRKYYNVEQQIQICSDNLSDNRSSRSRIVLWFCQYSHSPPRLWYYGRKTATSNAFERKSF